jgi:hypothetical protein
LVIKLKTLFKLVLVAGLAGGLAFSAGAQTINPSPFFTSFADTMMASTYNGQPLPIGSIIQAYDQSGIYCGVDYVVEDTATGDPKFGYFPVYGDDVNTAGVDEGAVADEQVVFKINGRTATVVQGDDTFTNQSLKSVTLSATATVAMTVINKPANRQVQWDDTADFRIDVRNDGDGIDFYGVDVSLSVAEGTGPFDWEGLDPDTAIYADPAEEVAVYFSVRSPTLNADTAIWVYYTVYSHVDPSVSETDSVRLYMTVTDVDDGDNPALPGSFTLEQNYPNPFNPTTTIAYNLSVGSTARLEVFDILGREVDRVELGHLSAGPGNIEYDGSHLASGVYLYRFSTESASETRKMILIK